MVQCGPLDKRAQKYDFDDKLMGELIRFVSSHEVGHTLGLRHNMVASSATPVEKLRDKKWVEEHGHTSSIMDYARFNYVAQPEDDISEKGLFPRVNDYDCWAIKWGYQWRPEFKDEYKEKKALRAEVTKTLAGNTRLRYLGDEGRGQDPRSQTEDLSDNDMRANEYGMKNLKRVMANIEKWTAQSDGQYNHLTDIYNAVLSQYRRYIVHVQRYIGGKYNNNWPAERRNDFVPKSLQKEALQWIGRNVLTVPKWLYPDNITDKTGTDAEDRIQSNMTNFVQFALSQTLLNNFNKYQKYPVNEWLDDVMAEVWKPLREDKSWDTMHQRQVERTYINCIDNTLNGNTDKKASSQKSDQGSDIDLYLLQNLDKIKKYIEVQIKATKESSLNYLHYNDLLTRIKKIHKIYEDGE